MWDLRQKPTESERGEGPHLPQALTNQRPDLSQLDQSEASKYRPLSLPSPRDAGQTWIRKYEFNVKCQALAELKR